MGNRIKKGDTVEVIAGNYRGERGTVQRVLPAKYRRKKRMSRRERQNWERQRRVVVSGINLVKKHQRPISAGRGQIQPGIIEFEAPIHASNVMLVCPHCNQRTRVGFTWLGDGRKVRVCKKCGEVID